MPTLDGFLDQAWSDHGTQPEAVAGRLDQALPLVSSSADMAALAHLAHHVLGEHLGRWSDGLACLDRIAKRVVPNEDTQAALARYRASLRLASGMADDRRDMPPAQACRVTAMAAACLCLPDAGRAARLLDDAEARAAVLPDADDAVRALAANTHNMAAALAEQPERSPAQRDLMLRAAESSRIHWARAGTWKEVERAEYRLALCWLAAGNAERALRHARLCAALVRAHGNVPLEAFFAGEALAQSAQALGDAATHAAAVAMAREAFDALPAADQAWCRPTLQRLNG